jgi:hypothetical protein
MAMPREMDVVVNTLMRLAGIYADELVFPSLVPIYDRRGDDVTVRQIGTGFLLADNGCQFLVTARHVLYGHDNSEDPWAKWILSNGRIRPLSEGHGRQIHMGIEHDIAGLRGIDVNGRNPLPTSCVLSDDAKCRLISIYGFLGRDFKRDIKTGLLTNTAFFYTNKRISIGYNYVGISYPRRKGVMTGTGARVHSPIPRGMSGCPMLDTNLLVRGVVNIVGVFTDFLPSGRAYGENSSAISNLINQISSNE